MNPDPKTIAEFQAAIVQLQAENAKLQTRITDFEAENSKLQEHIADLESINARLKAKAHPPENEPSTGITRVRFDR
jgi:septal ring factor EnvC (AmiA/AmiB activator)